MKKLLAFLLALLILVGGWYVHTPYAVTDTVLEAARSRNVSELNRHIDYQAIRQDLKTSLGTSLSKTLLGSQATDSGMGAFANLFANAMLTPLVDSLVTPEGLTLMLQAAIPDPKQPDTQPAKEKDMVIRKAYDGMNVFLMEVSSRSQPQRAVQFRFEREGLAGWKMKSVAIPESLLSAR